MQAQGHIPTTNPDNDQWASHSISRIHLPKAVISEPTSHPSLSPATKDCQGAQVPDTTTMQARRGSDPLTTQVPETGVGWSWNLLSQRQNPFLALENVPLFLTLSWARK